MYSSKEEKENPTTFVTIHNWVKANSKNNTPYRQKYKHREPYYQMS